MILRAASLAILLCSSPFASGADGPLRVYAAASLTDALTAVGAAWEAAGHAKPAFVFAASSTLAKQIEGGAPAGVFASADLKWMDYLVKRGRIDVPSRVSLLGNTLVLIAPKGSALRVEARRGFDAAGAFAGRLCTGETGSVPVGIYAKQALTALGWWDSLEARIVGTDDVRTALAFVARGECAAGIVYATDAAVSDAVEVVARFPADSHDPIVYPFALVKDAGDEARAFLYFVVESPEAHASFERYGFALLRR
jgi:molybdate transport system substrate-binding protein